MLPETRWSLRGRTPRGRTLARRSSKVLSPEELYRLRYGKQSAESPPLDCVEMGAEDLGGDERASEISGWDRYSARAVENTIRRIERYDRGRDPYTTAWLAALRRLAEVYRAGRVPEQQLFRETEIARQTLLRRERGVRPLEEWMQVRRNEPRRERIQELFKLGLNASEIAPEVGLSRSRVARILQEQGANPFDEWRAQVRNEPLRRRCVELREQGLNITNIAAEVGASRTRVRAILREEGAY